MPVLGFFLSVLAEARGSQVFVRVYFKRGEKRQEEKSVLMILALQARWGKNAHGWP